MWPNPQELFCAVGVFQSFFVFSRIWSEYRDLRSESEYGIWFFSNPSFLWPIFSLTHLFPCNYWVYDYVLMWEKIGQGKLMFWHIFGYCSGLSFQKEIDFLLKQYLKILCINSLSKSNCNQFLWLTKNGFPNKTSLEIVLNLM